MDKLIDRVAGADYNIALQQGKASYDDPRFRKADSLWDQLRPFWHPDVGVLQYNEAYMAFAQGQAAMQLIGSWIVGSYQTEMGLVAGKDYGAFAFPIVDAKIPTVETSWGANALVLTKSGAKSEAAKAFITFWGTLQAQQIFAKFVPGQVAVQAVKYESPILVMINKELAGRPMHLQFTPDMTIDTDLMKVFEKRALGAMSQDEAIKQLVKLQASVKK